VPAVDGRSGSTAARSRPAPPAVSGRQVGSYGLATAAPKLKGSDDPVEGRRTERHTASASRQEQDLPYQQRIDRAHPALVLMVLDQSSSMSGDMAGATVAKERALADAVNRIIYELVLRCVKNATEGPRHYYDLGLIGYGPPNDYTGGEAGPAWSGKLAGRTVVSSVDVAHNPVHLVSVPNGQGARFVPPCGTSRSPRGPRRCVRRCTWRRDDCGVDPPASGQLPSCADPCHRRCVDRR
jgi:hypothetical protein